MELYYHLLRQPIELKANYTFRPDSLLQEGFVHLSLSRQLEWVANTFLADVVCLWVMELDPGQLGDNVKFEDGGAGEQFPHLYGPIPHEAVMRQMPMGRDAAGAWRTPPQHAIPISGSFKELPQ